LVKEVKYVPLPAQAYKTAQQHFNKNKFGSVFVGQDTVGITIDELLKLEAKD
jgi:phosphate transport system substrate-binding protein